MGGSSKKVTVGYKYYLGMHMVLCHGPIDLIKWFQVDKRTAWQGQTKGGRVNVSAEGLFGGEEREGGISGAVDIEMGKDTQGRNDYLQARLGSDIPAFRGVVGAILRQCYLGMNPYLKAWSFRAQRIHVRQNGLTQWYDTKSEIGGDLVALTGTWQYRQVSNTLPSNAATWAASAPTSGYSSGKAPFGRVGPSSSFVPPYPINTFWGHDSAIWLRKTVKCSGLLPLHIFGQVENAAFVYFDGVYIGAVNPTNVDATTPIFMDFVVPTSMATAGDHTILIYAMDDFEPYGNSDNTYVYAIVDQHKDMNPAHIIRECLTDPDWGMGYQDSDIDDASFTAAADTLWDEKMGISLLWDRQTPLESFVGEIVKHIDAALYVSRTTGKFVLKLIRKDYDEETLIHLDESNVVKVDNPTKPTFGELNNSVTVNYWSAETGNDASVTVTDTAMVQMQGAVINTTVQYPGFTNSTIATLAAQRDLRSLSSPLLSCTIYADQTAKDLNIGDTFKFSWDRWNVDSLVMRVTGIAFGDGKTNQVRITCTQDVFDTPTVSVIADPGTGWVDPVGPPQPATNRLAFEAPYYELVQAQGQVDVDDRLSSRPELGYVMVCLARPGEAINARLWVNPGAGYEESGTVDFCPSGTLKVAVGKMDTSWVMENMTDEDLIQVGTFFQIGTELCRLDSIDTATGAITVGRGVLDSVPQEHSVGDVLYFWDVYSGADPSEYVDGETLAVKMTPVTGQGQLDLADAPEDTVVMDQRAVRPYPPGKFQLDGEYYPALVPDVSTTATWAHRDRTQQTSATLYDTTAGNIGPEAGTTYRLRLYDESMVQQDEFTGITGTSQLVDLSGLPTEVATIMIWSERGGLLSRQAAAHTFLFTVATLFVVLPLTYDEDDYDASMTWTRQGASPHVTPDGFEGNGWNARLLSTTIPTWMTTAGRRLVLHGSVKFYDQRPMNASGDTVVHVGANSSGVSPNPKLALKVLQDPDSAQHAYLALQTYTSSLQTMPLARPHWKYEAQYPQLTSGGFEVRPQALHFIDGNTLVVAGHYQDNETRVHKIDLTTGDVTGQFTFGTSTFRHVASFAKNAAGEVWAVDYETGRTLKIDLDASFTAGTAVILANWNTSILNKVSGIEFITVSGTEYVLIAEYATSGTPYLYVIPASQMVDGATFAVANRYKRFPVGRNAQGIAVHSGHLWASKNWDLATVTRFGWMERFNDIATFISGQPDGTALSTILSQTLTAPSEYCEDIKFHPTTGHLWTMTEGWQGVGDWDGFLSIWSSPADGTIVENHVTAFYNGTGTVSVKLNNKPASSASWTPTTTVAAVSVGGPPQPTADIANGFFKGYVKNVRFQNKEMTDAEYDDTIDGTTYEPNTLTAYTITLTNPGAETGNTTGWTNETGGLATRQLNPTPFEGAYYFNGGSFAQTIARQRVDLVAATGLTGTQIDAGNIWAKLRWAQASYTAQDPCTMGLRMLNSTPTQQSLTYGDLDYVPYGNSGATPNWQLLALGVDIPSACRYVDAVYRADRTSGTNNDGYIDSIKMTIYRR